MGQPNGGENSRKYCSTVVNPAETFPKWGKKQKVSAGFAAVFARSIFYDIIMRNMAQNTVKNPAKIS